MCLLLDCLFVQVREAETYKDADNSRREQIEAKNHLESFCYSIKQQVNENKSVFDASSQTEIERHTKDALDWLHSNPEAEKSEIEAKLKEVQAAIQPILNRCSGGGAGGGAGGAASGHEGEPGMGGMGGGGMGEEERPSGKGPKVEEVD